VNKKTQVDEIVKIINSTTAMTTYISSLTKEEKVIDPLNYSSRGCADLVSAVMTYTAVNNQLISGDYSDLSSWTLRFKNLFNRDVTVDDAKILFSQFRTFPRIGLSGEHKTFKPSSRYSGLFSSLSGCFSKALSFATNGVYTTDREVFCNSAQALCNAWNLCFEEPKAAVVTPQILISEICDWRRTTRQTRPPILITEFSDCIHISALPNQSQKSDLELLFTKDPTFNLAGAARLMNILCPPPVPRPNNNLGIVTSGNVNTTPLEKRTKHHLKNNTGEDICIRAAMTTAGDFFYPGCASRGAERTVRKIQEIISAGLAACLRHLLRFRQP